MTYEIASEVTVTVPAPAGVVKRSASSVLGDIAAEFLGIAATFDRIADVFRWNDQSATSSAFADNATQARELAASVAAYAEAARQGNDPLLPVPEGEPVRLPVTLRATVQPA